MAEFLIFAAEETLQGAVSLAAEEVSLAWGLREDLTRLSDSWTYIQQLLRAAEQPRVRDDAVRKWLNKLREIASDAEDVLDEMAYEGFRREVELQKVGNFFSFFGKVGDFFSGSNPIAFRFKMAHKVKKINMMLEQITNQAAAIGLVGIVDRIPRPNQDRETTSFVDDSEVKGRQNEVSEIMQMLINLGNQDVLSIIPIVGMAGLGKTTIAQKVFNDGRLNGHFDARIWVWVSENFDVIKILRNCLEYLIQGMAVETKEGIIRALGKELGGKRYLIVLDDVWNTNGALPHRWESLKTSLLQINTTKGNKIIVTTRDNKVASIMGAFPRRPLGDLSYDDCWSIFKDRAFADGGPKMTSDLEEIGRQIVKKCAGVPLAAKVLGGMMRFKKEKQEWELIQQNEIWNIQEDENQIMQVLKLSFDNLQPPLKQCFTYCSMLPKDFEIEKDVFIQLWMAQGFLQPSQESNLEMEDLGNKYFNTLLVNSLFQDATKDGDGNYTYCKIHDLVHDLAKSISSESNKVNDELHIQHLPLGPIREIPKKSSRQVRTLFPMDYVPGDMLSNFKGLRVLNLKGVGIDVLPISIGKLKHLRYLDVSSTKIRKFPKSIGKLYHLQTLRLEDCYSLEKFPNDLKNLINLRHMCIDNSRLKMPAGMGRLTSLQTLPYFNVGKKKGHRIEELGCLHKLRGKLTINQLEHVGNGEEAKKANLVGKTNIYKLELHWGVQGECNNDNENVLEGLQPHLNLRSLSIEGFRGDKFPSWIMTMSTVNTHGSSSLLPLNNLVEIKLINCNKCEQIPALGQLPFLRDFLVDGMLNVKFIGTEFYGSRNVGASGSCSDGSESRDLFPALKTFTLKNMRNLREWKEAEATPATEMVFPRLEKLFIESCPQLTTTPCHFSSLKELWIVNGHSSVPLSNITSNLTTLTSLHTIDVSELNFLPEGLLQHNKNLTSLKIENRSTSLELTYIDHRVLTIDRCPYLESIPSVHGLTSLCQLEIQRCGRLTRLPSGLESCTSLERLIVYDCPNLESIPEDLRELCSLSTLIIRNCGKLKCLPDGLRCLTRLKYLSIGGFCEELDSFPINFEDIPKQLEEVRLWGWPKLKSLPDQPQHLVALTSLSISGFEEMEALPESLGNLSSLEYLCIWKCKNLVNLAPLEAMRRLTKLQCLWIYKCPHLEEIYAEKSGPEGSEIFGVPIYVDESGGLFQHFIKEL